MSNTPNKRMVYIWPENLEFYDSLENKSDMINRYLMKLQNEPLPEQLDIEVELRRKLELIDATNPDELV